ncbi:MAG: transglycosylase domain-containing protein, partial [Limisphaerales bacterium]
MACVLVIATIPPIQVLYVSIFDIRTSIPALLYKIGNPSARATRPTEWMRVSDAPAPIVSALISHEDGKFCAHFGFDVQAIRASIRRAAETGKPPAGASTITQQCARSVFLWQGRSWIRKAIEAY